MLILGLSVMLLIGHSDFELQSHFVMTTAQFSAKLFVCSFITKFSVFVGRPTRKSNIYRRWRT